MLKVLLYSMIYVSLTLVTILVQGQVVPMSSNPTPLPASYYVNLNGDENSSASIREVIGARLSLKYEDRYGNAEELLIQILDWRRKPVSQFLLNKSFGLNYYDIDISSLDRELKYEKPYYCQYTDERNIFHEVSLLVREPMKGVAPLVNVFVNPIQTDCDNLSKSSIAFFGNIDGGKSPYRLTWYVINGTQTDLMFLPKEEFLQHVNQSPMISVDAFLDYYVLLHVEDACGAVGKQMVHVACEEEGQQVNTIYVQPLGDYNRLNQKIK